MSDRRFSEVCSLLLLMFQPLAWGQAVVDIVHDPDPSPPVEYAMGKLEEALKLRATSVARMTSLATARDGRVVVAGLARGDGAAARLVARLGITPSDGPEALQIRRVSEQGKPVWLVTGSDDRGLIYAVLDMADRVGWSADSADPLSQLREISETPFVSQRALSMYTMHKTHFEKRFHDEAFWVRYFDMLARNRFNTFVLIFGYENYGYFAPPYPYFFDVEGFPDVRVIGLDKDEQRRNLRALNRMIDLAHQRGLDVTLGIWDHIYRGNYGREHDRPTPGLVWGLTGQNLQSYTYAALRKFFRLVPGMDAIQLRMHTESGLKKEEMHRFWTGVYQVIREARPGIRVDARAKDFPDELIHKALDMGINLRMCTKYQMEHLGLPFHPTHIPPGNQFDRRHGYADMLRYPKRYDMHWRIWTGGTLRILLWGDPQFVRRLAESTHLYGNGGFEINEPLATKMQTRPHEMEPFEILKEPFRYYDWEFERYWHLFQVFGRVSYNPNTPEEVWKKEFERRFGREAAPYVEEALHLASWVLPRIVESSFPYHLFPTTRGWPSKHGMGDVAEYSRLEPSDPQQFLSVDEEARNILAAEQSPKLRPQENSLWFSQRAEAILEQVELAEEHLSGWSVMIERGEVG